MQKTAKLINTQKKRESSSLLILNLVSANTMERMNKIATPRRVCNCYDGVKMPHAQIHIRMDVTYPLSSFLEILPISIQRIKRGTPCLPGFCAPGLLPASQAHTPRMRCGTAAKV